MRTSPLTVGELLPALDLTRIDGTGVEMQAVLDSAPTVLYFMRSPTCPVCHSHLRQLTRSTVDARPLSDRVLVVVPGTPEDAAAVARRHPGLADRVVASPTAHEAVGLFVRAGLQQSGTFVVGRDRRVLSARSATVPLGAYSEAEVIAALGAPIDAVRPGE
jgi:peroxiredoxin